MGQTLQVAFGDPGRLDYGCNRWGTPKPTESRIEHAGTVMGARVWVLQNENSMPSGCGTDEATKRAAYYRERAAHARVKAEAARGL